MRWINLKPVIQREVSQKEKNKYCILVHVYGIQKNGTDDSFAGEELEKQTQRMDFWTQWGKGRVRQIERVALKYMHYHV